MAPAVRSFSGELWHPAVQGAVGAGPDQSLGTLSFRCGSIRLRLVPERVDGYNMGVGVASPLRPVAARRSTPPRPTAGWRTPRSTCSPAQSAGEVDAKRTEVASRKGTLPSRPSPLLVQRKQRLRRLIRGDILRPSTSRRDRAHHAGSTGKSRSLPRRSPPLRTTTAIGPICDSRRRARSQVTLGLKILRQVTGTYWDGA